MITFTIISNTSTLELTKQNKSRSSCMTSYVYDRFLPIMTDLFRLRHHIIDILHLWCHFYFLVVLFYTTSSLLFLFMY